MANIDGAGFRNAVFKYCKLLGLDFARCSKFVFSFKFEECILDYSNFFGTSLKKTPFLNCSLKEVEFTETNLSEATFNGCNLMGARFLNTNLEKADFRMADNFSIDLEHNKLKKAKFSSLNLEGLLYKYQLDIQHNH
ncbi:pentapeptide repeat protein [Sphingobacterium siyangense]|uniref:Pentapeptide repeat protein n=2 Tax=Sphingobacterium siyangense TaxID=459529 RepID=A0A562MG23_9SPHI|nr:pentapeptide repeat protein [Sphingobacterium siyangense]